MPSYKLIISGVCLAIISLGLGLSWQVFRTADGISDGTYDLVDNKIPMVQEIESLRQAFTERERILYEFYATTEQDVSHEALFALDDKIDSSYQHLNNDGALPEELTRLNILLEQIRELSIELDENLGKSSGKDWDLAREQLKNMTALGEHIHPILDALIQDATKEADQRRQETLGLNDIMKMSVAGYALVICLITAGVASIVTRYLIASEEKKQAQLRLNYLATNDELLGLPNRNQLELDVQGVSKDQLSALVLLRVDRMEGYSSTYGFSFVDNIMQAAANRIYNDEFKGSLYRFNDSTFAIYLVGEAMLSANAIARKIKAQFDEAVQTSEGPFYLSLSMGYLDFKYGCCDFESMIKYADAALKQAIADGGNKISVFSEDMYSKEKYRLAMEHELENAINKNELHLFYQPKTCAKTGRTTGYEALIRWHRKKNDWVSPAEFIPLAEQSGQILAIGSWVIREACNQISLWREQGHENFSIAVNISARQFQHHNFISDLLHIVEEAKIPPSCLELEITESAIMQDVEVVMDTLQEIKSLGFTLAIDDFGTGYSSLSYLTDFPIDKLKIDKSFVDGLTRSEQCGAVVETIIDLAHNLNLSVVAEGVEEEEQLAVLQELGCEEIQGYLVSKPVPSDQAVKLLSTTLAQVDTA